MGRHAAPELDSPTEVIARPGAQAAEQTAVSLDNRAKLGAFAAIGAVLVGFGVLASMGSGHSSSSSTTTPAQDARAQGVDYAAGLKAQGYNSLTVMGRCQVNDGGYGGSYWEDYSDGCNAVGLQMMENGR